jgi:uroporphyrinogen decarboxylase
MDRTMTSKERVKTAFACREPDRVPINYHANQGIDMRLKEYYGLKADDNEGLLKILGVDFRGAGVSYRGPKLHEDIPSKGISVDNWGIHRKWVEHETGGYWDYCDFPLDNTTEEQVAEWPMPSPDDFDYSDVSDFCMRNSSLSIFAGSPGAGDIINGNGMLRGMEQTLVDLVTDDPAGLLLAKRRTEIILEINRRTIEASKDGIDFLWTGEDLGTQIGPIISMEIFRKHIRPIHQKFVDMAKSFNIPVMIHSCGSSSWAYEDFIEMGISAVDTLQPEAKDMSPEYLKKTFGGCLAFHGCISTAGPVSFGTVAQIVEYCRKTLDIMMPGGGYCFAPTHCLQDNSPVENVVAMYETAKKDGSY